MGFRDRIVSIVPGIKNTDFGKKIEIGKYVKEYSALLQERENVYSQIHDIEQVLGLTSKPCKNLDEMCSEIDRLEALRTKLNSIYNKGKEDPSQLSENELLTFQRLNERQSLINKNNMLTIQILALRQGLMNIADPENSKLSEDLNAKYMNSEEFIKHSSSIRLADFLKACRRTGVESLPSLSKEDITDLVVSTGTSPQAKELVSASPMLKMFVEKLTEVNERTGYTSGKYPLVPFNFEKGSLEGEIKIAEVSQRETTEKTKND